MSFAEDDVDKKMVPEDAVQKSSSTSENSTEFMVVGEEIVVENMDMNQEESQGMLSDMKETTVYFDDSMIDSEKTTVEYTDCAEYCTAELQSENDMPEDDMEKWVEDESEKHTLMLSGGGEREVDIACVDVTSDDQDGDEETIATFVTAAGQQLALYAVEDSEDIFAVAVYDESGEPPSNFQFLMKSDVERLIGEGAVRTVKKPTQIKKQLLTTQPPLFFSKPETIQHMPIINGNKIVSPGYQKVLQKKSVSMHNPPMVEESEEDLYSKSVPKVVYTSPNKQPDVAYLMMDEIPIKTEKYQGCQEAMESDENTEILEQSTVQYILFEGDQSDSDLTFDDIQEIFQNVKKSQSKSQTNKQVNRKAATDHRNYEYIKKSGYTNGDISDSTYSALEERKTNSIGNQKELQGTTKFDLSNSSTECTSPEITQAKLKAKRPRKQQLISVNRDDSEIIIQPASLLHEEEITVRKRGKRKRRMVHSHHRSVSKRIKRVKRKEVEIIEIDVEEDENGIQGRSDVVEITIDDGKDKYSSDKENEIIMVGDSDEESPEPDVRPVLMQCQYCSRNFRQQRVLETHLRVCSKSPSNAVQFAEQKLKHVNRTDEVTVKKQYSCKTCQKKFDVVVALARHVRSEHSQRKKRRYSKSSVEEGPEELPPPNRKKNQLTMIRRVRRRKAQRPSNLWEGNKLSCTDCGRWFPSTALLSAHCLQHETKKAEQQIRRCQVCKKLIKSRQLFIQHIKKHANVQSSTKHGTNIQKKLHTTRSVTRKITTLRKRGRP